LFFLAKYLENASKSQHARRVNAALAGLGLAHLPEDQVQQHIAQGRLVQLLADRLGYHLIIQVADRRRQRSRCW
jgi:DNA-binding transcriptional LysR family regulator